MTNSILSDLRKIRKMVLDVNLSINAEMDEPGADVSKLNDAYDKLCEAYDALCDATEILDD